MDIRDADNPESSLTLRRLFIAFNALPKNNAVARAASGLTDEESSWSPSAYILANVFDAVQQLTYLTEVINTQKNRPKPRAPKPHPRPGRKNAARPRRHDWFPGETIKC